MQFNLLLSSSGRAKPLFMALAEPKWQNR